MNKTLRALAALLSYPDEALVTALPEIQPFVSTTRSSSPRTTAVPRSATSMVVSIAVYS